MSHLGTLAKKKKKKKNLMCTVKNNLETIVFSLTLKRNKILQKFQRNWTPWKAILLWCKFYKKIGRSERGLFYYHFLSFFFLVAFFCINKYEKTMQIKITKKVCSVHLMKSLKIIFIAKNIFLQDANYLLHFTSRKTKRKKIENTKIWA